jgi:hypothetical protein
VKECDSLSFRADSRGLVNQPQIGSATLLQCVVQVIYGEADMMYPRSALRNELSDRRIVRARLEEFNKRFTRGKSSDGCTVGIVKRNFGEPKHIAIEGKELVQRLDCYSDVSDASTASNGFGHGFSMLVDS